MKNSNIPHEADKPFETTEFDVPNQTENPVVHADEFSNEIVPAENTAPTKEVATKQQPEQAQVRGSFAGGTWIALIVGALLLILLLVFILQNQQETQLHLFAWSFSFPAGIGYLLAAITGALIMALVGGVRMIELRRQVKKQARRSQN
ncbi:LapA family protein [Corynebacterium freiburgense]|uniref:LapA family protein n=1 Tax=Corynebacterium freiburgense TaxID=556548 RepID=UPI000416BC22|nr:lipopolysaccharide assembly protein LapA domain-containing protein [Corynebacterium freiburgense]WJZ03017.1 hypothetical protein CFREI_08695 [Corynebacterium freiburgense]